MCKLPLIYIPVQNYTTENHKKTVKVLSDAKIILIAIILIAIIFILIQPDPAAIPLERKKGGVAAYAVIPHPQKCYSPVPILSGTSHIPAGRSLQKAWPLNRPSEAAVRGFVGMDQFTGAPSAFLPTSSVYGFISCSAFCRPAVTG